jgi:hypothetical protein
MKKKKLFVDLFLLLSSNLSKKKYEFKTRVIISVDRGEAMSVTLRSMKLFNQDPAKCLL